MKNAGKLKGFTGDFLYSMAGLVALNGVLQLLVYPYLNRQMGPDAFGEVLTLLSLVAIMGSSFGTAANYSRMVSRTKGKDSNGDYNNFLVIIIGLSVVVSIAGMIWLGGQNAFTYIAYFILMSLTVVRYYADVEFRLNINYKRFFLYYLIISIGYVAGILLYPITKSWIIVMALGEFLGVMYVVVKGSIFKGSVVGRSRYFKENLKSSVWLSLTYLISALVLNSDRIMLQYFDGGVAVTCFYAATLIGKMISLISAPLNGVIIGHLARFKGGMKGNTFVKLSLAGLGGGVVMNAVCVGVSYVFVWIMYRDIFDMVKPYLWIANAGQIFFFISNILTVILLRFTHEKYQLYINLIYLVIFVATAIPLTAAFKLWGMAWALLAVNVIKLIVVMIFGKVTLDSGKGSLVDNK